MFRSWIPVMGIGGMAIVAGASAPVSDNEEIGRAMMETASACWPAQQSLRGIGFSADVEVAFTSDGRVGEVDILRVEPATEPHARLAREFADRLAQCGPYRTGGAKRLGMVLSWPI